MTPGVASTHARWIGPRAPARTRRSSIVGGVLLVIVALGAWAAPAGADKAVDPSTWLAKPGTIGRIPFDRTIAQTLPNDRKWQAHDYVDQWPATAWLPDRWEIASINGGHQVGNVAGVIYSSLRTLTRRIANQARTAKSEAEMPVDGTPDNEGVLKAMHGYNGFVARRARWGFGKDLFVVATLYSGAPDPMAFYDPDVPFGGADVFFKGKRNRYLAGAMGYGKAAESDVLKGFFAGDAWRNHPQPQFGFFPGDMSDPDLSWPDPIGYGNAAVLVVDDARKLYLGINSGDSGYPKPSLVLVSFDPASPHYRKAVQIGFAWPAALDGKYVPCDRFGFTALKGKGIVGIGFPQNLPGNRDPRKPSVGIQIRLGADPFVDPPKVTVPFTNVPIPPNGAWGSHKAIDELGITAYDVGPDEPMVQINWPSE